MKHSKKARVRIFGTLVLALILFATGAGQAMALERPTDGEVGAGIVSQMLERLGNLLDEITSGVLDVVAKEGSEINPDGLTSSLKEGSEINPDG